MRRVAGNASVDRNLIIGCKANGRQRTWSSAVIYVEVLRRLERFATWTALIIRHWGGMASAMCVCAREAEGNASCPW